MALQARVGVTEEERSAAQEVRVALALYRDLRASGMSDDLSDTVDYDAVCSTVGKVAIARPYRLIEALAESVARAILDGFPVDEVEVRVEKPSALRAHRAAYAAVEIRRGRDA
jgi:dihydroneopterin aldolase